MTASALTLRIELVPSTCWYKSLREQMPRAQWDKLRKKVYADQNNVCAICAAADRLNCHEVWEYDDARRIQRLLGFQAVCSLCHHVTHFGKATLLVKDGRLDLNALTEHFMRVNGVDREVFEAHRTAAFRVWRERSLYPWKTDLGEWAALVAQRDRSGR